MSASTPAVSAGSCAMVEAKSAMVWKMSANCSASDTATLFHAQALRVLQFGDNLHIKGNKMFGTFHIIIDGSDIVFLDCASYD